MTTVRQLSDSEIEITRKHYTARQKYRCPICKGTLAHGINALDHDHKNGMIRATLCQSCNVSEGKVKAGVLFRTPFGNLAYKDSIQWLRNLADYLEFHKEHPSNLIHPTFNLRTGKQQPVARKTTKKVIRRKKV